MVSGWRDDHPTMASYYSRESILAPRRRQQHVGHHGLSLRLPDRDLQRRWRGARWRRRWRSSCGRVGKRRRCRSLPNRRRRSRFRPQLRDCRRGRPVLRGRQSSWGRVVRTGLAGYLHERRHGDGLLNHPLADDDPLSGTLRSKRVDAHCHRDRREAYQKPLRPLSLSAWKLTPDDSTCAQKLRRVPRPSGWESLREERTRIIPRAASEHAAPQPFGRVVEALG